MSFCFAGTSPGIVNFLYLIPLRELFPESAFRWRKDSGLHHTYHDCVQSDAVEDALNLSHRIPFLAKGREDTVDKFIAWLVR